MKHFTRVATAVSALVSTMAFAGPHTAKSPSPDAATAPAPLPEVVIRATRVTQAVEGYLDAMSTHDVASLSGIFTDDAVVEFIGDEPGAALSVHADSLLDDAGIHPVGARPRLTDMHVFPTKDGNAVFVQYDFAADSENAAQARNQVALVEMRGDKIAKMVNFNAPPASIAQGSACATPRNIVLGRR